MYTIEQLEHEVWILQGNLQELRNNKTNSEDYFDRLNYLEFQLHHMQNELQTMKGINPALENLIKVSVPSERLSGLVPPSNNEVNRMPYISDEARNLHKIQPIPSRKKLIDLEKTFGTGIMGIVASVLVFISIIIFGTLLIPYLSEGMMVGLMFLISFAIAGVGYFLLTKNSTNKFNLSLCACGVTAIAVSLFVTRILFGFIDNIIFLVLMSVWMAMMTYLCRKYNYIFRIIGEIGILMTCILGLVEISFSAEWYSYIVLVIVFGISALVFNFAKYRETYEKNTFSHILHTIALIAFAIPFETLASNEEVFIFASFIMGLTYACLVAMEFYIVIKERVNNGILFYILSVIQMFAFSVVASLTIGISDSSIYMLFSSIILLFLFSTKQTKFNLVGDICVNVMYFIGAFYFIGKNNFGAIICVVPLMLYGFYKHKKIFLYGGLVGISSIFLVSEFNALGFLFWAFIPFVLFLFIARKEQDKIFTSIGYPWLLFIFAYGFSEVLRPTDFTYLEINTMTFLMISLIHILIVKTKILNDYSKVFEIVSSITTAILMIIAISTMYNDFMTVLVTLFTVALFLMNSKKLLAKSELWGYYIALKYTVLMLVILDVSWGLAIVYSICMLLFSLASILLGFLYNHKSFRIYGLLLSMISVFKLILFDVDGKSMAYNAFGFLICGLICFGISFVYNKIEQKLKSK